VDPAEDDRSLLASQVTYYRRRAAEYDATAYGDDLDVARERIVDAMRWLAPSGNVLEIACGTGMWTQELARRADSLTAIDAAPEALALARHRVPTDVHLLVADVFDWQPDVRFDAVFMAFWLSHVPRAQVPGFLERIGSWLLPHGRILIVDEHPGNQAKERYDLLRCDTAVRTLRDGSDHRLVKVYVDPGELQSQFHEAGWLCKTDVYDGWVLATAEHPSG